MSFKNPKIAFLQKPEVLPVQKELILSWFGGANLNARIDFFSSATEIPDGEYFDIVIAPTLPWLDDALSCMTGVRWIHFLSAGIEKIWDMSFDKNSVLMSKSSGVHVSAMSEFVIGAILYFEKQFNRFVAQSNRREWSRAWLGELGGKKMTVLGAGAIGQKIAERGKLFDMKTIGAVNKIRNIDSFDNVVTLDRVSPELKDTDYLICCLPLTGKTKGVVDFSMLARLKPGAVLVDISRGGVVCEAAVLSALDLGILRGAALDVFEQQPLSQDSLFWGREDVLLTPHVSGTTQNYMSKALEIFARNFRQLQSEGTLSTPVDVTLGY